MVTKEIPVKGAEIISRLVSQCKKDITKLQVDFQEMRSRGEEVGGFLYSFITDEEYKIKGLQFCEGKTIEELKKFLEIETITAEDYKKVNPDNPYDRVYADQNFRSAIKSFLKELQIT